MKCDKCLTEDDEVKKYAYMDPTACSLAKVTLCHVCNCVYESALNDHVHKDKLNLLPTFMEEDYGSLSVSVISKDIINARKTRALGKSPWMI